MLLAFLRVALIMLFLHFDKMDRSTLPLLVSFMFPCLKGGNLLIKSMGSSLFIIIIINIDRLFLHFDFIQPIKIEYI